MSGGGNLAQLIPAMFTGPQGQRLTPEQIERQRAMAQTLLERATDTAPNAGGWASILAKGIQGFQAGRDNRAALEAEKTNTQASNANIASLLSGFGGSPSAPTPSGVAPQASPAAMPQGESGDVFNEFMGGVREQISNPYALAAIAGTGQRESRFSPANVRRTWSDPSESGQAGTSGGIMSWRGPRYAALAATGDLSPAGQARFFLGEDPQLVANLQNAGSLEEAQALMNNAWRFAGFNRPGGETAERIAASRGFLPQFQNAAGEVVPQTATPAHTPTPQPPFEAPSTAVAQALAPQQSGTVSPQSVVRAPQQSINPAILQTLANPYASPQERSLAQGLLQQQQAQQQALQQQQAQRDNWIFQQNYQQQQQANDPKRNLEIRKLEQDLNRGQPLINAGDGRLYNPNTESWVEPPEVVRTGFRPATTEEASKYGSQGGQFGPDGRFYPINPPSGTSLSVDPATGQVRFDQGSGVKPLTEGQSKDVVYSTRARGALDNLGDLDTLLANPVSRAANYDPTGVIRGNVQSPDFQVAQNAGREFLQAVLRKDTGAAITKEETSEYGSVYLPVPGDSPKVIQQKRQARARAIAAMEAGMPPHAILQQERALEKSSSSSSNQTNDVSRSGVTRSGIRYERVD